LEHDLTGDALGAVRLVVEVAELALGEAVGEAGLLLLLQLGQVLGGLAPATAAAVLAGRVGATVEGACLAGRAEDVDAESTSDAAAGSGVSSHVLFLRCGGAWAGGSRCAGRG